MKLKLLGAITLGMAVLVSGPAMADHKGKDRHHDQRYSASRDYRDHDHGRHYRDRDYRYEKRYDKKHAYRHGYRDGHRSRHWRDDRRWHKKHHRNHYRRHGHDRTIIKYRNDDDWYKWLAGAYIAKELIHHHYHGNHVCYDRH
ncbi:MAG: hypothetical protein ACWA5K_05250 [bacterium]